MKYLVVFYSRTGVTKKVAQYLAQRLSCDCEEIIDKKVIYSNSVVIHGVFIAKIFQLRIT